MTARRILEDKGAAVITASPDDSVADAARILNDNRIGAVVVREDGGEPLGVFSERDLSRVVAEGGAAALDTPVRDAMSRGLVTAGPGADVPELMNLMTDRRVRHVLIMEAGRLIGVVSIGDVVKKRIAEAEAEAAAMKAYIETT